MYQTLTCQKCDQTTKFMSTVTNTEPRCSTCGAVLSYLVEQSNDRQIEVALPKKARTFFFVNLTDLTVGKIWSLVFVVLWLAMLLVGYTRSPQSGLPDPSQPTTIIFLGLVGVFLHSQIARFIFAFFALAIGLAVLRNVFSGPHFSSALLVTPILVISITSFLLFYSLVISSGFRMQFRQRIDVEGRAAKSIRMIYHVLVGGFLTYIAFLDFLRLQAIE